MSELKKMYKAEGKTKKIVVVSCQECPINQDCSKFKKIRGTDRITLMCGVGIADCFHNDCPLDNND